MKLLCLRRAFEARLSRMSSWKIWLEWIFHSFLLLCFLSCRCRRRRFSTHSIIDNLLTSQSTMRILQGSFMSMNANFVTGFLPFCFFSLLHSRLSQLLPIHHHAMWVLEKWENISLFEISEAFMWKKLASPLPRIYHLHDRFHSTSWHTTVKTGAAANPMMIRAMSCCCLYR